MADSGNWAAEEMRAVPAEAHEYPHSHPSSHDNPLAHKSVKELKELLQKHNVDIAGMVDKDDLVDAAVKAGIKG